MAENTDRDPNEEMEGKTGGKVQPFRPPSEQEQFGTNLNPVIETPSPFGGMRQGGGK